MPVKYTKYLNKANEENHKCRPNKQTLNTCGSSKVEGRQPWGQRFLYTLTRLTPSLPLRSAHNTDQSGQSPYPNACSIELSKDSIINHAIVAIRGIPGRRRGRRARRKSRGASNDHGNLGSYTECISISCQSTVGMVPVHRTHPLVQVIRFLPHSL
ncbi:hypothetical protein BS47DRAFT_456800 [Hydnum rufescens UP504]|uniref:Uncharacterized protein n=1 Tax=Hydnum rufescens UP504 TaxID=1448309 RepID=A0A9P6DLT8_9AGAM|nr:hypothetical protein BS47DRAFT_456800 [Hydnum rufescens UP504]